MMGLSHHPHVLPLLAVYDEPEQTHFVLRLCSTVTLFDRIPRKPSSRGVEERVARRYLAQIASALEHLHAHSICHRDVKPENCLFDVVATGGDIDAAALRLADFGCARELGPAGARTLVGTIEYAAPELLRQKANYHCGVDVWSAGVVYYVLLCGCYPFADENARALRKQILKAPLDDLLSRLPPLTHRAIAAGDGVEEFKDVDDARADAATAESLVMARGPKRKTSEPLCFPSTSGGRLTSSGLSDGCRLALPPGIPRFAPPPLASIRASSTREGVPELALFALFARPLSLLVVLPLPFSLRASFLHSLSLLASSVIRAS